MELTVRDLIYILGGVLTVLSIVVACINISKYFVAKRKEVERKVQVAKDETKEETREKTTIVATLEFIKSAQSSTLVSLDKLGEKMNNYNERLVRVEERCKSNTHRLNKLDGQEDVKGDE